MLPMLPANPKAPKAVARYAGAGAVGRYASDEAMAPWPASAADVDIASVVRRVLDPTPPPEPTRTTERPPRLMRGATSHRW
jgi:hypothetical protein